MRDVFRRLALATIVTRMGLTLCVGAHAQETATARPPDPLVWVAGADALEVARVTQRLGDRAVLERLDPKQPTEVRLAAIGALPYLRQPELALGGLAPLLLQRDPWLAQAAARAVLSIVRVLDQDVLARHEVAPSELGPACKELSRASQSVRLRADLRALVTAAVAMLRGMAVPCGE